MPDDTPNPDRAQVRDLGAVSHNRPIMADLGAIPGVIGVSPTDADVRRLQDEIAYLTRDRDRWRERAFRAEARLAQRVGCGGAA